MLIGSHIPTRPIEMITLTELISAKFRSWNSANGSRGGRSWRSAWTSTKMTISRTPDTRMSGMLMNDQTVPQWLLCPPTRA